MSTWKERVAVILAVATMLPLTALPAVAAGQGGGGGRPGGEELSGNNLSYPVVFTGERATLTGVENEATLGGTELGKTFS